MRCWRCKSDMPDGVKYCGNCGVHMNRAVHVFQWLFSKKGLPVLILLLALILGAAAWYIIPKIRVPVIEFDLDMGWYTPKEEDIVYHDDNKNFGYVSNMILVFFTKDATDEQITEVVQSVDGEVVGIMPGVRQYQIRVVTRTEEELEALRKQLMEFEVVKNAVIDYVTTVEGETAAAPNDPWLDYPGYGYGTDWDETDPDGTNWWAEATRVLSAWEYQDSFSHINVGIVDNGYDTTHEDLEMVILNSEVANAEDHGTHVAGIMGATADNGVGITGVLKNATLYCVDCYATEAQETQRIAVSSLLAGIDLCIMNDCRVVNMSSGLIYDYALESPNGVEKTAREAATYLIMMIDAYDRDFIVVQSAGNGDNNSNAVDACRYNGYFTSITPELVQTILDEMKADGVKLEKDISVDDVMNSLMVIGAVDMERINGEYQLSEFSNYGETLTVCAPGVHILSTVPTGNNYAYFNGTSMAAPLAASITAMVWSVDQELTGAEVQEIVLSTATTPVRPRSGTDSGSYYMIDAQAAVEKALQVVAQKQTEPSEPVQAGSADKLMPYFDRYVGKTNYDIIQSSLVTSGDDGIQYYWDIGEVDPGCETLVDSYMNLILEDTYQLELIHQEDDEYFYTYTGSGEVDPLEQHEGMSQKIEGCYLWIKLVKNESSIHFERWCSANFDFVEVTPVLDSVNLEDLPSQVIVREAGVVINDYTFHYDAQGRITQIVNTYYKDDGSEDFSETKEFSYLNNGLLAGFVDEGTGEICAYMYDDDGRLILESWSGAYTCERVYEYDENGVSTGYCSSYSDRLETAVYEHVDSDRINVTLTTDYVDGSGTFVESWSWLYGSDSEMEEVIYEYEDHTTIERIDRSFRTFILREYEDSSGLTYYNLDLDMDLGSEYFSTFWTLYLKEYQIQCESGRITFISDPAYDRTVHITYCE